METQTESQSSRKPRARTPWIALSARRGRFLPRNPISTSAGMRCDRFWPNCSADPQIIAASKQWPDCVPANGRAENLLFYEDPDYGFAINGLTKGEARHGQRARIHDHAHIYTLYGVLDGRERVVRYDRLDDRSKPDYAEIRESSNVLVSPGEIDLVKPYEIHTELTVGERTVAVIIRSQKGGDFNQGRYIPEENKYYESLGPRQTPCEMLPRN